MAGLDFSKQKSRDRIARNGSDNIDDMGLPVGMTPPRARRSKADLRAELAQAEAKVARLVVCRCGHRATVTIPSAWVGRRTLKCTKCDARVPA